MADGGTGVSTLTDGGVLYGSGAAAITATAVLTDGQMIVGDNSGDPALESGATLRTSIGVAIGSDVQAFDAQNALTDTKQVWTKAQAPSTFSATLASVSGVLDYDAFQNFIITLASGSNTLATVTTEADCIGQTGVMIFIQPSSSSAGTLALHADYETAAAAGITLSTANNAYDIVPYIVKAEASILLGTPQLAFA